LHSTLLRYSSGADKTCSVRAVNPTCANASAAKYLFAKMKRDTFYSDVLGKYIEKVGAN
jgi:hypothetical protein